MINCAANCFELYSKFQAAKIDIFNRDLQFIKNTILENHPGVCNILDPNFLSELNKSCEIAQQQLNQVSSENEKMAVLQRLGKSFKDSHLWVHYNSIHNSQIENQKTTKIFNNYNLNDNTTWITLPTFAPSKNQIEPLREIIRILPLLRHKTIIFDLRGNGGGNSSWGTELLEALFGLEYSNYCIALKDREVYADWRASVGNLKHVESFIPTLTQEFKENHPTVEQAKATFEGIKNAVAACDDYYSEPKISDSAFSNVNIDNPFKGKIMVIIDRGCVSACLDFLDGLRAIHPDALLIGESTGADSVYMELRTVLLPSCKGTFGFPIKVYRNRSRGHNVPYLPDIHYNGDLKDTLALQKFILSL